LPKITRAFTCGDKFLEGRLRAQEEALTGLCEADAAGCAAEERRADALFERADHLADRRWTYAKDRGCLAKIAMLRDTQERLHAIERALSDCEVVLHGP
jgi:hypothetical protein